MFEPVRMGVIGLGAFGRLHALTLAGLAEAELVALVDCDPARRECMARALPGIPLYDRAERAIAESSAQAWVVATPTAAHVELAGQVLRAGGSVLVEKPLAPSLDAALQLQAIAAASRGQCMAGHILLFSSEFRGLLAQVRQRGPVTFINSVRHRPAATRDRFPDETPLGLLMVHDLYLAYTLMNAAAPGRLRAHMPAGQQGTPVVLAEITWPDGALASCCASFLTPPGMADDGFDRLEVFGTGWAARMLSNPRPLQVWGETATWPMALEIHADREAPSGMLAEELRCFCRVVCGSQQVPLGARLSDAIEIQRWMQELERSAAGSAGGR